MGSGKVAIHQPEHLPWLGFFDKMSQADTFVILDNVQYRKNYFQNRNKIRTDRGWQWVTVPVKKSLKDKISDVLLSDEPQAATARPDNWTFITQVYRRAPHFAIYADALRDLYLAPYRKLSDLNMALLRWIAAQLEIAPRFVLASELSCGAEGGASEVVFKICAELGAATYVSGISGKEYLELDRFAAHGIEVRFQEFYHPIYRQMHEPFLPCMSALDMLFNCGTSSRDVLLGASAQRMTSLFL